MTTGTLEARLRGALADPVGTDQLRAALQSIDNATQAAIATFTRDPWTKRTTLVEIAETGEPPFLRMTPTYDAAGLLTQVDIKDLL